MRVKNKKLLIFILTIFMTAFMLPTIAFAAEDEVKVGENFSSLEDAITKVKESGGIIELQSDVTLSKVLDISTDKSITIKLNNHKINSEQDITIVARKGEVILSGEGEVNNTKQGNRYGTLYVKGSENSSDTNYTHLVIGFMQK